MKKNNLTRKEFILKSGKCVGGLACTSLASIIIQSCNKPDPLNNTTLETKYISECPCHLAQFDQDGNVLQHPTTGETIEPLQNYSSEIINNQLIINHEGEILTILISDYPNLEEIGGVALINSSISNNIDSQGLLLYRESEHNIIVLSRKCTHQGCTIGEFINI